MKEHGFSTLEEAVSTYTNQSIEEKDTSKLLKKLFFKSSLKAKITKSQPFFNVVVLVCESWGSHFMDFETPTFDLLGPLRKHIKEDYFFRNFQSVRNGTGATLQTLITGCSYGELFHSKYARMSFPSSIAFPFVENGYETFFFTGMDQAWGNLSTALPHQGFQKIVGKYELLHAHPEYGFNHPGVFDHHLLNSVMECLEKDTLRPRFILCLTTTNHPPYEFPTEANKVVIPDWFYKDERIQNDKQIIENVVRGYCYTNKVLGHFLNRLKQSPLKENTIVAITGDHNVRALFRYDTPKEIFFMNQVPLYLYIPQSLREKIGKVDLQRWGDHYDIFPTIYPLVLNSGEYFCAGKSMLTDSMDGKESFSFNDNQVLSFP